MERQARWNPTIRYAFGFLLLLVSAAASDSASFATAAATVGLYLLATTTIGVVERLPSRADVDQTDHP
ncbi:MAG: hypothetical protein GY926_18945 [bacterium]|nr:hypothetical protein [bacterium]